MPDSNDRPRVLIEESMPVKELGIEAKRERSASSALPPMSYLHVWWARRPLTVSRAALLASMLPADTDREWFLEKLGVFGDPVAGQARIRKAKRTGEWLDDPYGYPRACNYRAVTREHVNCGRIAVGRVVSHQSSQQARQPRCERSTSLSSVLTIGSGVWI